MKKLLSFCTLLLVNLHAFSIDGTLEIDRNGFIVQILNFEDGDTIKLFEIETGDHILSKSRGEIDLAFLPIGEYLIENSFGESVVVEKTGKEIVLTEMLEDTNTVEKDAETLDWNAHNKDYLGFVLQAYAGSNPLEINREGNLVTVVDYEDGDVIKVFEVNGATHIVSKKADYVDLSQLATGLFYIVKNDLETVIVEKK